MRFDNVKVRFATRDDYDVLLQMSRDSMTFKEGGYDTNFIHVILNDENKTIIAELNDGRICGYICYGVIGNVATVHNLWTYDFAPIGAGYSLITALIDDFPVPPVEQIIMLRNPTDTPIKLYDRLGFKPVAVVYKCDITDALAWRNRHA